MLPLLASLARLPAAPPLQRDVSLERAAELAALVDLPRAQDRHKAALELAADEKVSLEQWPVACRAFAPRGEGTRRQRIDAFLAAEQRLDPEGRL